MTIQLLDTVGSTNDLAMKAAPSAKHGDTWVAEHQTAGRGRREIGGDRRQWFSPPGVSLYMSVLLKPAIEPAEAAGITLAAGVGVCEALSGVPGLWLKWPNDIFIGTRKVGGLLTEASTQAGSIESIVVGLGLNVNVQAQHIPKDLEAIMTSLAIETGQPLDRLGLVHRIHASLIKWSERYIAAGFDGIEDGIKKWDKSAGRRVQVIDPSKSREGVAKGIKDGSLLVRFDDGDEALVFAGEVKLIP